MILVINSGSSSLKFKAFDQKLKEITGGLVERIGQFGSFLLVKEKKLKFKCLNHQVAFRKVLDFLVEEGIELAKIKKVGHRVVHGGEEFTKPVKLNLNVVKKIEKYNDLAPLHNPKNLFGIKAGMKLLSKAEHFAVFDTAFHATIPQKAALYPIPVELYKKFKIRRYGFHGTSHQYVAQQAAVKLKKPLRSLNLITCHLGSGCSITAVRKGKSVDTSMGFTPLEGLMMSTRSGDIDPAVVLYLLKKGMLAEDIDKLLNSKSGLVGMSGFKDMRDILVTAGYRFDDYKLKSIISAEQKKYSQLTLEMFVYRVQKYIGAYSLILGKVDAVVFTAGIGERSATVRNLISIKLNKKIKKLVVPTNEELMIAKSI